MFIVIIMPTCQPWIYEPLLSCIQHHIFTIGRVPYYNEQTMVYESAGGIIH